MRLLRFYDSVDLTINTPCVLGVKVSHHMVNVLRMSHGDHCQVFDGRGVEVLCEIVTATKKQVTVRALQLVENKSESVVHTHLAQALCKSEKMDWIVQKAVELGVNEITPIVTERCDVRLDEKRVIRKLARWRDIAISGCEQCGRASLPKINSPQRLQQFVANGEGATKIIFTPCATQSLTAVNALTPAFQLLVGPEGGLSDAEIKVARDHQFGEFSLGKRVLRTETAAIAGLSIVQALFDTMSS